jgi:hypothetical protein
MKHKPNINLCICRRVPKKTPPDKQMRLWVVTFFEFSPSDPSAMEEKEQRADVSDTADVYPANPDA